MKPDEKQRLELISVLERTSDFLKRIPYMPQMNHDGVQEAKNLANELNTAMTKTGLKEPLVF